MKILFLGDSITRGIFTPIHTALSARGIKSTEPSENCQDTAYWLLHMDEWIAAAGSTVRVIYFNVGLHDLHRDDHVNPRRTAEDYATNLDTIVTALQALGVKLVWGRITPVGDDAVDRENSDVIAFNAAADAVISAAGIPSIDLYSYVLARQSALQSTDDTHMTTAGYADIAAFLEEEIFPEHTGGSLGGVLNSVPLNYGEAADTTLPDISTSRGKPYRLEIRTRAGVRLWFLEAYMYGGNWQQMVNQPDKLQLSVAGTFEGVADLVFPHQIWLFFGDYTTVWQKFDINVRTRGATSAPFYTLEIESIGARLGREIIESSVTFPAGTPIGTMLGALLYGHQTQDDPIRLGHVDAAIGKTQSAMTFSLPASIADCLGDIHDIIGGHYWVDADGRLNWQRARGLDRGWWVRLDKQANQIRERTDWRELATRVVAASGAGARISTRNTVTVDDAAAQAEYGVISRALVAPTIKTGSTLALTAAAELDDVKVPKVSFHTELIDLAALDSGVDYNFEQHMLAPGNLVRVVCADPAMDYQTRLNYVLRDLDEPVKVQVQFGNPEAGTEAWGKNSTRRRRGKTKTILEHIAEIKDDLKKLQGDTGIIESVNDAIETEEDTQAAIATAVTESETIRESVETVVVESETITERIEEVMVDALGEDPLDEAVEGAVEHAVTEVITNSETVQEAIVDATAGTDTPEPIVSTTGDDGETDAFARIDHTHQGMPWLAATDKAGLAAIIQEGEIGHTTGSAKALYAKEGGSIVRLTAFEVET